MPLDRTSAGYLLLAGIEFMALCSISERARYTRYSTMRLNSYKTIGKLFLFIYLFPILEATEDFGRCGLAQRAWVLARSTSVVSWHKTNSNLHLEDVSRKWYGHFFGRVINSWIYSKIRHKADMCWTPADHLQLQLTWGAVCRISHLTGFDLSKPRLFQEVALSMNHL